jgi:hypothetical protein
LIAANESGEDRYYNEHRTEKHFERGTKGPPGLRALYRFPYSQDQSPEQQSPQFSDEFSQFSDEGRSRHHSLLPLNGK